MYEKEVKEYCRCAGGSLACGRAQRRAFDSYIQRSVQDYLENDPGASWAELEQVLGPPQDAAELYMSTLPPGTALHWTAAHKRRRKLAILAMCLAFALLVGIVAFFVVTEGVVIIEAQTTIAYDFYGSPPATAQPIG